MKPEILVLDEFCCCDTLSHRNFLCHKKDEKLTSSIIYIQWFYGDSEEWLFDLLNKSVNYYKDNTVKEHMYKQYLAWLYNNTLMPDYPAEKTSQRELFDLQLAYKEREYNTHFKHLGRKDYENNYVFLSNPYIGFYIEHLGILACHGLSWQTQLLPINHSELGKQFRGIVKLTDKSSIVE